MKQTRRTGSETFTLNSGREFDANCHMITPCAPGVLSEGYDGTVHGLSNLNPQEVDEIVDYMILEWEEWRTETRKQISDTGQETQTRITNNQGERK